MKKLNKHDNDSENETYEKEEDNKDEDEKKKADDKREADEEKEKTKQGQREKMYQLIGFMSDWFTRIIAYRYYFTLLFLLPEFRALITKAKKIAMDLYWRLG